MKMVANGIVLHNTEYHYSLQSFALHGMLDKLLFKKINISVTFNWYQTYTKVNTNQTCFDLAAKS